MDWGKFPDIMLEIQKYKEVIKNYVIWYFTLFLNVFERFLECSRMFKNFVVEGIELGLGESHTYV